MNNVAIAFSTKDRVELSRRTVEPLLQPDKFDLFWIDGSDTLAGQELYEGYSHSMSVRSNIKGGADAAIVYSLTEMLNNPQFKYVGLVENDVLLAPGWFEATMDLFRRGKEDGLNVGAVSARAYEDRILMQRDGYAVMHNIGAGMIIFTREAAEIVLQYFRTTHTGENRSVFAQLSGLDIGRWWAFRTNEHFLCADWGFDKMLVASGLASLALTPSPVEMIGQVPSLAEQGLTLVTGPVELLRNDDAFKKYKDNLQAINDGMIHLGYHLDRHTDSAGQTLLFPHQFPTVGAKWRGEWRLKWAQGFGPFSWEAVFGNSDYPALDIPVYGPAAILMSGGKTGGKVHVQDLISGYECGPELAPDTNGAISQAVCPAGVSYRTIRVTALSPGVRIHGLLTKEPQPWYDAPAFDHNVLPKP